MIYTLISMSIITGRCNHWPINYTRMMSNKKLTPSNLDKYAATTKMKHVLKMNVDIRACNGFVMG